MAGHSKWAQIKRKKAVKDNKKGATFARISREIIVAAKLGGADPAGNFRLRTAIENAKAEGIPNDNIKRAIEKGAGGGGADQLESLAYEGYGPGGVAILIEAMTDNRNRTAGDIRSYFNKYQGNLGSEGCVSWIFEARGVVHVKTTSAISFDAIFEVAVEAGATDVLELEDGLVEIVTAPDDLNTVCHALEAHSPKIVIESAEATRIPQNTSPVSSIDQAKPLMKLLSALEDQDDVQAVYANFEMDDALLEAATMSTFTT